MSRKKGKNRNVKIGIFAGKESTIKYHEEILESLFNSGSLTAWEVAQLLVPIKDLPLDKNRTAVLKYRAQKIYSAIQRKGARLDTLKEFDYINVKDKKYTINAKGVIALFIHKPELFDDEFASKDIRNAITTLKEKLPVDHSLTNGPFGISVNGNKMRDDYKIMLQRLQQNKQGAETLRMMIEEIKELLRSGIDLDLVDVRTLASLLTGRMKLVKTIYKIVKK